MMHDDTGNVREVSKHDWTGRILRNRGKLSLSAHTTSDKQGCEHLKIGGSQEKKAISCHENLTFHDTVWPFFCVHNNTYKRLPTKKVLLLNSNSYYLEIFKEMWLSFGVVAVFWCGVGGAVKRLLGKGRTAKAFLPCLRKTVKLFFLPFCLFLK